MLCPSLSSLPVRSGNALTMPSDIIQQQSGRIMRFDTRATLCDVKTVWNPVMPHTRRRTDSDKA